MKTQYFKEYSQCLERDMEFKVYGEEGAEPVLVFPSQDGRFYDFENQGMIESVAHLINAVKHMNSVHISLNNSIIILSMN